MRRPAAGTRPAEAAVPAALGRLLGDDGVLVVEHQPIVALPGVPDAACAAAGIAPDRLAVEVLEHDPLPLERVAPALEAVAATGASVALDDLGSGYAGISHLRAPPVSIVTLDRPLAAHRVPPFFRAGS